MRKSKVIKFDEFMNGGYKEKEKQRKKAIINKTTKIATAAILPLATGGTLGTLGFAMKTFAATTGTAIPVSTAPIAVEVGAKEWMSAQSLDLLTHVLDPLVDILVALAFPVASVIIVGSCFFFMFGKAEKGFETIMKAGLGYVLIMVSPLILDVLKQIGSAV